VDPFWLKLVLSFLVGGAWITLATVAAERFGSKVGGFMGGLPSTVVVAMLFIGWTQGRQQVYDATTVFPLAFAFNALFLIAFALGSRRGLLAGVGAAVLAWGLAQVGVVSLNVQSFFLSLAVWLVMLVAAYLVMARALDLRSHERVAMHYTPGQIAGRAAFAGGMIALAVVMSKVGGPVLGGVFSAFPAVYLSTLVITSRSAGLPFARAMLLPLMISGVVNCVVYTAALRLLVLPWGVGWASLGAYAVAGLGAWGTYVFIRERVG